MAIQFEVSGHYTYFNSDLYESCVFSLSHWTMPPCVCSGPPAPPLLL